MIAQTVVPAGVSAATYSQELQEAYDWAYSKGVTTMSPIDNANMYGAITRAEMAKMLSVYAKEVLGKTPDTSKACTFSDIDSVKGDLHDYIIESCQLGIMGQGITAFRPYSTITRAEFGTALSRLLYGIADGTPYYATHLDKLKQEWIMTQIDNPENRDEIRGYVMLMLMRSEKGGIDCDDPVVKLACTMETDECPAACKEGAKQTDEEGNVVKSGDLAVKAVENKGAKVIANQATSELDTLTFKASEDITLNSITLERYGLSNADSIDAIWLEDEEGNEVTAQKSISTSKDTVTLSIKKDYKNIWQEASFIVVVKTASWTSSDLGTNVGFKVTDVDSSAKNLDLSNYSANLYDFIDYTGNGVQVEFKGKEWTTTYNYEAGKSYEVAKVRIYATKAAVSVNGFTLTNNWTLDLDDYVEDVEVLVNGTTLKNVKSSVKNDELKISFDDQEIAINKNEIFTVKVTISEDFDDFGDTINFKLDESTDLNVVETKNNVRVEVNEKSAWSFVSPTTYKFNGAKINLTNTKLDKTIEAAQGSTDVKIAEGKIALGGQSIRIDKLKLEPSIAADVTSVKLVVDDEEYEATSKNSWTVSKVVIEEDSNIKILVDVDDNAGTGDSITLKVGNGNAIISSSSLSWLVKYDTNNDPVEDMLGSISVSTLKVQEAKGSLTNNSTKKAEFTVLDTTTKTVFDWTFTAKKQDTHLNNVTITLATGTILPEDNVTFHVYIDGDEVASFEWADEADFSEIVVEAGKSVSVKVDADVYASTWTESDIQYKIQLKGEDENNNDISTSAVNMVKMAFVDSESITVTTNSAMRAKDVILTDSDQEIAAFIVKPSNKASVANLDELRFDVSDYTDDDPDFDASTSDADEYFEVKLGKNDTLDVEFASDGSLVVEDINKSIEWETQVTVIYKKDLTVKTNYDLVLTYANATLATPKTFSRYAVDALVRVASQAWDGTSSTKYTFNVDYSDNINSETIQTLKITYVDGAGSREWWNVVAGDTYTTANEDSASDGKVISYTDGDGNSYTIDYDDYPDYFRVSSNDYVIRYAK